jgi:hypothetical protein
MKDLKNRCIKALFLDSLPFPFLPFLSFPFRFLKDFTNSDG